MRNPVAKNMNRVTRPSTHADKSKQESNTCDTCYGAGEIILYYDSDVDTVYSMCPKCKGSGYK